MPTSIRPAAAWSRRHPALATLAALIVLGLVTHYWIATLILTAMGVTAAVLIGRHRHRAREQRRLLAAADQSLAIAHQHGLAALLEQRPR